MDPTCSIEDCTGSVSARGWCGKHYQRWRKTGDVSVDLPDRTAPPSDGLCSLPDCDRPFYGRGYCRPHSRLDRLYGDPRAWKQPRSRATSLAEKIADNVLIVESGCHVWTAGRTAAGYGQVVWHGRKLYAHRAAWEATHGPIPDGLLACHHCDNPPCCNPAHLFLGTTEDNIADKVSKGRARGGNSLTRVTRVKLVEQEQGAKVG